MKEDIRKLAMNNVIVNHAMAYNICGDFSYERALEFCVIELCKSNEDLKQKLINIETEKTWHPMGHVITKEFK